MSVEHGFPFGYTNNTNSEHFLESLKNVLKYVLDSDIFILKALFVRQCETLTFEVKDSTRFTKRYSFWEIENNAGDDFHNFCLMLLGEVFIDFHFFSILAIENIPTLLHYMKLVALLVLMLLNCEKFGQEKPNSCLAVLNLWMPLHIRIQLICTLSTDLFTTLELENPSNDTLTVHEISCCPDLLQGWKF